MPEMTEPVWTSFPIAAADPHCQTWLTLLGNLGRSSATIDAYGRGLDQYLRFCRGLGIDATEATLEQVSLFVRHLRGDPGEVQARARVSDATLHQRLTAVRLWYDHLVYAGVRERNPVPRGHRGGTGRYEPEHQHQAFRYGLVRRLVRLPGIPSEADWTRVLAEVSREGLRNRLMFALAYYGALRREELTGLRVSDLDVAHRLISVRPETSKGGRGRVVAYPDAATPALANYLVRRHELDRGAGPLFLSESDRNPRQPLTKWTWSKVVERLARQAGVEGFSTHTLRHLRLTHLARTGWQMHEIATYAGHRNPQTTAQYIHLSGGSLSAKMAASVGHLDAKLGATLLGAR